MRELDGEQAIEAVIEEGDGLARLRGVPSELFEQGARQAGLQGLASRPVDAEPVTLRLLFGGVVAFEHLDGDPVTFQPLRKAEAAGAGADDEHFERFAGHPNLPTSGPEFELGKAVARRPICIYVLCSP